MSEKREYRLNWNPSDMQKKWTDFVRFGNSGATEITGKNFDKWLKDAGVIDGKVITITMTGIAFSKIVGVKKKANFAETQQILVAVAEDRARASKKEVQEELDLIIQKLSDLEAPLVSSASKISAPGVYSRLTDHTKYTGAHKERFHSDGKGKGKAGREDIEDNDGYTNAYKNKGTYGKTH